MTSTSSAAAFAAKWKGRGDEKQDCHPFWIELLQKVYGVQDAASFCRFEVPVMLKHKSFIDVYLPHTRVLIEQKSAGINLAKPEKQSDGTSLTPYEQGKRYADVMPFSERPRWIIACNFTEFWVYDQEKPNDDPQRIALADLPKEAYRMNFLTDVSNSSAAKEMELSRDAGELVGKIYNALLPAYGEHPDTKSLQDLNKFIVRLVFCFYAEDAGLFGKRNMFHDYMASFQPAHFRKGLMDLFEILDKKEEARDPFDEKALLAFPYVNGSLFTETTPIPPIDDATRRLILEDGCGFDWENISPTIFGSIFEGTLNPDIRRQGGMHYTSLENIHKVIDPLFVNEYRAKFQRAMSIKQPKTRATRLRELQEELSRGRFFDPACGSGNFLTESYLTLRRLENDILRETDAAGGAILLGMNFDESSKNDFIKVNIQQFYGIEINDFACAVAKTALWIAESQMFKETLVIVNKDMDFLPLSTNANIHEGNALRMNWKEVLQPSDDVRIMGNPPFVGKSFRTPAQKDDMKEVFHGIRNFGNLDYVTSWYIKAARYMEGTRAVCAFVSTNSICQGIAVPPLWDFLVQNHASILFAYQSFPWNSESRTQATVHCVIIGFTLWPNNALRTLYKIDCVEHPTNINPYLLAAPNIIIHDRHEQISNGPLMAVGSFPTDGGGLVIKEKDYEKFLKKEPKAKPYVRPYIGPDEFIKGKKRYCLWLKGCSAHEIKSMPAVMQRIQIVRESRLNSPKHQTQARADTPTLFAEDRQPDAPYLLLPRTSSELRTYLPIGFMPSDVIAGDVIILPNATLFHFGLLCSNVHNAWMRLLCGRLEMRYRYSNTLVYNNLPFPNCTQMQKNRIEATGQAILDARKRHSDCTMSDLYNNTLMPIDLRKAHEANDRAVMAAYGFRKDMPESEIVIELLKMYEEITQKS